MHSFKLLFSTAVLAAAVSGAALAQTAPRPDDRKGASAPMTSGATTKAAPAARAASAAADERKGPSAPQTSTASPTPAKRPDAQMQGESASAPTGKKR